MVRTCLCRLAVAVLALAVCASPGFTDAPKTPKAPKVVTEDPYSSGVVSDAPVCKVYSLAHLGSDSELGPWLVKMVPQVVQPGTWSSKKTGKHHLSYYQPGKVLVVYHTEAAQTEVAAFLKNLQRALPVPEGGKAPVVQAQFAPPAQIAEPVFPAKVGETAKTQPKHLFHLILEGLDCGDYKLKNFTLRYEGEGIIDQTVAKLIRALNKQSVSSSCEEAKPCPPESVPAPPALPCYPPCRASTGPSGGSTTSGQPTAWPRSETGTPPAGTAPPSSSAPSAGPDQERMPPSSSPFTPGVPIPSGTSTASPR